MPWKHLFPDAEEKREQKGFRTLEKWVRLGIGCSALQLPVSEVTR